MTDVILYDYWRSSSAYRVRIGLNLIGLAYRSVPVDLTTGAQRDPKHLKANPQGLVPVLDIDGLRLTQSLAILEYLDETRAAGFLPKLPAARARARALACAVAMEIQPVCNLRVAQHAVSLGGSATMAGWMRHFITLGFQGLEPMLTGDTPFCHGTSPGAPAPALPISALSPRSTTRTAGGWTWPRSPALPPSPPAWRRCQRSPPPIPTA